MQLLIYGISADTLSRVPTAAHSAFYKEVCI